MGYTAKVANEFPGFTDENASLAVSPAGKCRCQVWGYRIVGMGKSFRWVMLLISLIIPSFLHLICRGKYDLRLCCR